MKNLALSPNGLKFIKDNEGLSLVKYADLAGNFTCGYGHLITSKDNIPNEITAEQAEQLLTIDCLRVVNRLNRFLKTFDVDINQNAFDALCDFIFNLGIGSFESSTLATHVKFEEWDKAAEHFEEWCHAGGKVVPGLLARRQREKELFLKPIDIV